MNTAPKISMVIPCYTLNKELERLAVFAAGSYRDQVDELIIVEDGGMFSDKLMRLADVYTYYAKNGGFTKNVNRGWKQATGEYVMIVNSDTYLYRGNLSDLCVPGKVTSPYLMNQSIEHNSLAGPFWCAPALVTQKQGYLLEEMHTYSSDSEYASRIGNTFQKVLDVIIYHEQAQTVKAAGVEGGEQQQKDKFIYEQLKAEGKAA